MVTVQIQRLLILFILVRACAYSMTIEEQIDFLDPLCISLTEAKDQNQRHHLLDSSPFTKQFMSHSPIIEELIADCSFEEQIALKGVLAIGQGPHLFYHHRNQNDLAERFKRLAKKLVEVDQFYSPLGGIPGYHLTLLKLIQAKGHAILTSSLSFSKPPGLDLLRDEKDKMHFYVRCGIEQMPDMAEIYPIGGAGDRLNLKTEQEQPLPAALLPFCGSSLLEGLIRDLQGREYLYYKLYGQQLALPLALMTSHEKNNDAEIRAIFEKNQWFGRSKERCAFFIQPLVPVLTIEGNWAMQAPLEPFFKPGGHGVLWKAARDQGIFDWLQSLGSSKALLRQINNPVAGMDNLLLALCGLGCHEKKQFGFASCPRLVNAAEGMDVLIEKQSPEGYEYCISNIEYTDFKKYEIEDRAEVTDSLYSRFPANTNILFVDLHKIEDLVEQMPFPGMMVNMKTRLLCDSPEGKREKACGRLESLMQNIADSLCVASSKPLSQEEVNLLPSYVVYNERRKTLSTAKKAYESGKPLVETPEGCFYELMQNYRELLSLFCHMHLPLQESEEEYLSRGPSFITLFHPALGGLFQIIGQKIRGGRLANGSEWLMEIAEADVQNLDLDGSLIVHADSVMGKVNEQGILEYSSQCGKCVLHNVTIRNQGCGKIDFRHAWKQNYHRKEALTIKLHGNAEFVAQNILFEGNFLIEVPDGHRLTAIQQGDQINWIQEKITHPTWEWHYQGALPPGPPSKGCTLRKPLYL